MKGTYNKSLSQLPTQVYYRAHTREGEVSPKSTLRLLQNIWKIGPVIILFAQNPQTKIFKPPVERQKSFRYATPDDQGNYNGVGQINEEPRPGLSTGAEGFFPTNSF